MADRWQKNERYLLMIQYQILFLNILNKCRIKSSNFCCHQIKYFLYFLISNDPLCTPTTYSFQKKRAEATVWDFKRGEKQNHQYFLDWKGPFNLIEKYSCILVGENMMRLVNREIWIFWYFKKILSKSQHCNDVFQIFLSYTKMKS